MQAEVATPQPICLSEDRRPPASGLCASTDGAAEPGAGRNGRTMMITPAVGVVCMVRARHLVRAFV